MRWGREELDHGEVEQRRAVAGEVPEELWLARCWEEL
jgi:hypothetical protein